MKILNCSTESKYVTFFMYYIDDITINIIHILSFLIIYIWYRNLYIDFSVPLVSGSFSNREIYDRKVSSALIKII